MQLQERDWLIDYWLLNIQWQIFYADNEFKNTTHWICPCIINDNSNRRFGIIFFETVIVMLSLHVICFRCAILNAFQTETYLCPHVSSNAFSIRFIWCTLVKTYVEGILDNACWLKCFWCALLIVDVFLKCFWCTLKARVNAA